MSNDDLSWEERYGVLNPRNQPKALVDIHREALAAADRKAAELIAENTALQSKLDAVREVIYEQFTKGKCSELVAVGLIEKIVREPK